MGPNCWTIKQNSSNTSQTRADTSLQRSIRFIHKTTLPYPPIFTKNPSISLYKFEPNPFCLPLSSFLFLFSLFSDTGFSEESFSARSSFRSELANSQETLEETGNKGVVLALYEALSSRDVDKVQKLLASDLEWWFHGPPSQQFLMRLLTGTATSDKDFFNFVPQSIAAFGSTVLVEGSDPIRNITWVHAWTVTDGIVTQVREYFNTSLTVTRIGNAEQSDNISPAITSLHCPSVWESSLSGQVGKSVPGLVLAI